MKNFISHIILINDMMQLNGVTSMAWSDGPNAPLIGEKSSTTRTYVGRAIIQVAGSMKTLD